MNCKFCNQPCEHKSHPYRTDRIGTVVCKRHPYLVTHYFFTDVKFDGPVTYEFVIPYRGKDWHFSFDINGTKDKIQVWHSRYRPKVGEPGNIILPFTQSITPENALGKLPTILLFS